MIPYPQGLTFGDWAALVVEEFAEAGVPVPPEEDGWREWGERIQEVDLTEDVPYPEDFEEWFDWAQRVVDSLEGPG